MTWIIGTTNQKISVVIEHASSKIHTGSNGAFEERKCKI